MYSCVEVLIVSDSGTLSNSDTSVSQDSRVIDLTENVPSDSKLISGTFCKVSTALLKCGGSIMLHLFNRADKWLCIAKRTILFAFPMNELLCLWHCVLLQLRASYQSGTTIRS